jgi:hypothetical protein
MSADLDAYRNSYCYCQRPLFLEHGPMKACSQCRRLYHSICLGVTQQDNKPFICGRDACRKPSQDNSCQGKRKRQPEQPEPEPKMVKQRTEPPQRWSQNMRHKEEKQDNKSARANLMRAARIIEVNDKLYSLANDIWRSNPSSLSEES